MQRVCSNCRKHKPKNQMMRCGRCGLDYYCSKLCQKMHWVSSHKMACKMECHDERASSIVLVKQAEKSFCKLTKDPVMERKMYCLIHAIQTQTPFIPVFHFYADAKNTSLSRHTVLHEFQDMLSKLHVTIDYTWIKNLHPKLSAQYFELKFKKIKSQHFMFAAYPKTRMHPVNMGIVERAGTESVVFSTSSFMGVITLKSVS